MYFQIYERINCLNYVRNYLVDHLLIISIWYINITPTVSQTENFPQATVMQVLNIVIYFISFFVLYCFMSSYYFMYVVSFLLLYNFFMIDKVLLTPLLQDSSLPCAVFVWDVINMCSEKRTVSITFTFRDASIANQKKNANGRQLFKIFSLC